MLERVRISLPSRPLLEYWQALMMFVMTLDVNELILTYSKSSILISMPPREVFKV